MIKILLSGAVGNQLFIYSFYRAVQEKGIDVVMDTSWFDQYEKKGVNHYRLDQFDVKMKNIEKSLPVFLYDESNLIHKICWRYKLGCFSLWFEKENGKYDKSIFNVDNKTLVGTWQTEKYFKEIETLIRNELKYIGEWNVTNNEYRKIITRSKNPVSIHIRRGDYIKYNRLFGDICTDEYYKKAISHIENIIDSPTYFFFSDDIKWCKEHYKKLSNVIFVEGNTGSNSHMDMILMSYCKHHVIANSSYSWWGAWLGKYDDTIIISPKRWINGLSCEDIWCGDWLRF